MNVRSLDTGAGPFRPLSSERSAARAFRGARVAVCGFAVLAFALGALGSVARPVLAQIAGDVPEELDTVGITEHVDEKIPLDLEFVDEDGREIKLGDYFDGKHPVVLALAYYECPMLCSLVLTGVLDNRSCFRRHFFLQFGYFCIMRIDVHKPSLRGDTRTGKLHTGLSRFRCFSAW